MEPNFPHCKTLPSSITLSACYVRRGVILRLRRFVGQTLPVLVEGQSRDQEFLWEARLQGMAPEIDGKLYLTDIQPQPDGAPARPGDMARIEITKALDYDLVGRVVAIEEVLPRPAEPLPMHAARQISTATPLRILA